MEILLLSALTRGLKSHAALYEPCFGGEACNRQIIHAHLPTECASALESVPKPPRSRGGNGGGKPSPTASGHRSVRGEALDSPYSCRSCRSSKTSQPFNDTRGYSPTLEQAPTNGSHRFQGKGVLKSCVLVLTFFDWNRQVTCTGALSKKHET